MVWPDRFSLSAERWQYQSYSSFNVFADIKYKTFEVYKVVYIFIMFSLDQNVVSKSCENYALIKIYFHTSFHAGLL